MQVKVRMLSLVPLALLSVALAATLPTRMTDDTVKAVSDFDESVFTSPDDGTIMMPDSSVLIGSPPGKPVTPPTPSSPTKLVFAHFIVGNTYNYTQATWAADIKLAASKGIDAFALNVGSDSWENTQVSYAYAAAQSLSTPFKLFMSFDMSSLPCAKTGDGQLLRTYVRAYANHPNQLLYNGKVFVSTFAGENCKFGQSTVNQGWTSILKTSLNPVFFVPSFFVDPKTFPQYTVMDGAFGFNSGWPQGDYDIDFSQDQSYISNLGSRSYMAAASPWFFTHYGPQSFNKNFIYRADDWLLDERWESLIQNRSMVNFVEVNTWNDYGESHYVGPIEGIQPMSQAWVNGFDHTGWLDLIKYYATAYKTGTYPTITQDRTFLWARLYPAAANTSDPVGKPMNWQWTEDYLWAVFMLPTAADVTLTCGTATMLASAPAGLSKYKLPLLEDCSVSSTITRGATTTTFTPDGFKFSTTPTAYNFNAFVAASPEV